MRRAFGALRVTMYQFPQGARVPVQIQTAAVRREVRKHCVLLPGSPASLQYSDSRSRAQIFLWLPTRFARPESPRAPASRKPGDRSSAAPTPLTAVALGALPNPTYALKPPAL